MPKSVLLVFRHFRVDQSKGIVFHKSLYFSITNKLPWTKLVFFIHFLIFCR